MTDLDVPEVSMWCIRPAISVSYTHLNGDGATDPDKNYCHISEIAVLGVEE